MSAIGNGISGGSNGQSGGSNRTSAQEQSKYGRGSGIGTNLGSGTTGQEGIICKFLILISFII